MQTQMWQKCWYSVYTVRSYVCWLYEQGTPTKTECCCTHSSAAREEGGENRLNCEYVTLGRQTSSTRIAKHRSFIKLKLLQNFCSSCKTLADQLFAIQGSTVLYLPLTITVGFMLNNVLAILLISFYSPCNWINVMNKRSQLNCTEYLLKHHTM